MKIFAFPAVVTLALLLSACGDSGRYTALSQMVDQQNQTILDQQQTLLDQQKKLTDQEVRLSVLSQEVDLLKKMQDQQPDATATADNPPAPTKVDATKVAVVRQLTGFSARLSADIGYGAYSDALSDLNANLMQSMLDLKDQTFADEVNRILNLYNYAGEFWQHFAADGSDSIRLTPTDRYKYANVGVNFTDNYNPRPTDVKKFWAVAADELQKLMDYNRDALGRDDNNARIFAR